MSDLLVVKASNLLQLNIASNTIKYDHIKIPIEGGSGGGAWGEITGSIADQEDLQLELGVLATAGDLTNHIEDTNNPHQVTAAQAAAVATTGDESIDGVKTFTSTPILPAAAPTLDTQAVNKSYVDNFIRGLDIRSSCLVATTGDITLSGAQTIDNVSVVAGDRVLVKDQSTGTENGIYVCATGAWSRASDYNEDGKVKQGTFTFILEGDDNATKHFAQITKDPELGVDALVFTQIPYSILYDAGDGLDLTDRIFSIPDDGVTNAMLAGSIANAKLNQITTAGKVSGAALTNLTNIPSGAGVIPIANLATGTPTGAKYVRDDGTLAVPEGTGGGGSGTVESVIAGDNVTVDDTDPANPIVSANVNALTPYAEVPTGDVDGVNTTFTLANTPSHAEAVIVVLNGVTQYNGTDYTVTDDEIEFTEAPADGSTIFAYYSAVTGGGVGAVFSGLSKITVSRTAPSSPRYGDLWLQIE